jgi:hypothetical protein
MIVAVVVCVGICVRKCAGNDGWLYKRVSLAVLVEVFVLTHMRKVLPRMRERLPRVRKLLPRVRI